MARIKIQPGPQSSTQPNATAGRPAVGLPAAPPAPQEAPASAPAVRSQPEPPLRLPEPSATLLEPSAGLREAYPGDVGDEVSVEWAEEKITPRPNSYSSCTTGNVSYTTRVRPGETAEAAFERAYGLVSRLGEKFRAAKVRSFLAFLDACQSGQGNGVASSDGRSTSSSS